MWSAYQIFAHPMFDTLESHVKAFMLRRAKARGDTELPARVEELKRASMAAKTNTADAKATPMDAKPPGAGAEGQPQLRRLSRVSAMSTAASQGLQRLSQNAAMYRVSTGFVNETVPSNEEHFLLPIWQRVIIRSCYVVVTTIIAVVMPFFGSMAGLVGALAFFPLTIFFPIECWRRVYKPKGWFNIMLASIEVFMGLVSIAATIASVRNIINSWGSFKIFGSTGGIH
uniref:Amino acid transporter transmembrane domain-containing protein n=1 Tax=Auxenochlorella protothecoides TaxID=3075 RepID=A0A1D1ZRY8_AUXPR